MSTTTLPDPLALAQVKQLLNKSLRIVLNDGRVFMGTFAGTDKQLNLLLINTDEYRLSPPELANTNGRFVGLVMIPRRLIVSIETPSNMEAGRDDRGDLYA